MRVLARSLLVLLPTLAVSGCMFGAREESVKSLPPMSKNCEWLQERSDDFVAQQNFCEGMTPDMLLATKPKMGGALLESVSRSYIGFPDVEQKYFRYDLTFRTRSNAFVLTTISTEDIDFPTNKFYAVDLLNACRIELLNRQENPSPRLLDSFLLPNKLACL